MSRGREWIMSRRLPRWRVWMYCSLVSLSLRGGIHETPLVHKVIPYIYTED